MATDLHNQIRRLASQFTEDLFTDISLQVFHLQSKENKVYNQYLNLLQCDPSSIHDIQSIPLLPIQLFKNKEVKTGNWKAQKYFLSSGTGESGRSKHLVKDTNWYDELAKLNFEQHFGPLQDYVVIALLPNYLETGDSSLVHMVNCFIKSFSDDASEFLDFNLQAVKDKISSILRESHKKILLIGVSFALIDLTREFYCADDRLTIIFTGGMKGRGEELDFRQISALLSNSFPNSIIRSEYGMTELLSQSYSDTKGVFSPSNLMRVVGKDQSDPLSNQREGKTSLLGVIDLANIDSCSFILTQDLGLVKGNTFEIVGRAQDSDIRGCNLLYFS